MADPDSRQNAVASPTSVSAEKATLAGEIRNRSDTEKSYTLTVEFLDKTGAVVGTGSATVDKVAAKSSGRFSITTAAPGIVAFRYKPIA